MLAPVLKPYKPAVDFQIVIHSTKRSLFSQTVYQLHELDQNPDYPTGALLSKYIKYDPSMSEPLKTNAVYHSDPLSKKRHHS